MQRLAVAVVVSWFLAHPAAAAPCADGAACEAACKKREIAACARGAELYLDGVNGHALDHRKSFQLAKRACDAGYGHGCALLGLHYQDGLGTAYAPKRAIAVYEKGCRAKAGVACYNLASMYYGAHGVVADSAKGDALVATARKHWEAACHGDEPRWCTNLAFLEGDKPDRSTAEKLHQRACDHGVRLGCLGVSREKFDRKAITAPEFIAEHEKLCDAGEASACGIAGPYLLSGTKMPKDGPRGFALVKRGCERGDKQSCLLLGNEYSGGPNTKRDLKAALDAFSRACDRAKADACQMIAEQLASGRFYKEAAGYARRACHMGKKEGCDLIARQLLTGTGIAKNGREGLRYAWEACARGSGGACGELVRRNRELPVPAAAKLGIYKQACQDGHKPACKRVGKLEKR